MLGERQGDRVAPRRRKARSPTPRSRRRCGASSPPWTSRATTSSPRSSPRAWAPRSAAAAPRPAASRSSAPFWCRSAFGAKDFRPGRRLGLSYGDRLSALDIATLLTRHDAALRLADLLGLARRGRRRRHAVGPHGHSAAYEQRARQDRHPVGGEQPVGLRHKPERPLAAVLGAHETRRRLDRRHRRPTRRRTRSRVALARSTPGGKVSWSPSPAPMSCAQRQPAR